MLSITIEKEDFAIILKSNEHKSYAWVFSVICTFQSSKFLERLSMHSGVVYHMKASYTCHHSECEKTGHIFNRKKLWGFQ
jgi:hypothetical protein